MANTILTPTKVTREALRVLHQKLNIVGNVNRQYDKSFAQEGAKIGDELKIRLPNQYQVFDGADMSANFQDTTERSASLKIDSQKVVPMAFTDKDLTLSLDDFSERIIEPAMAVLAANIEADVAVRMKNSIYNQVTNVGSDVTLRKILDGGKILTDNLAPRDKKRSVILSTQDNVVLVDTLKGTFNPQDELAEQYREGLVGRTGGFNFFENTLVPSHTVGTKAGTPLVNGASQVGASIITDGWTNGSAILKKGDIITFTGVFRVHPETKLSTGVQQQFVVGADVSADGSGNATIAISPAIVTSGALQNVTASPADNIGIQVAGTASTAHGLSLGYHKDAFVFATADLFLPKGAHFAGRETMDGISMRVWKDADVKTGKLFSRVDVLYGFCAPYPQLGVRYANN